MFNVEICVDLETYQAVQQAIKSENELVGTLVLNELSIATRRLVISFFISVGVFEFIIRQPNDNDRQAT